eukprot:3826929-Lingulodinium_polyedra.AAC.1
MGSASSPPGLGSSKPSGPASGHAPASSTASRTTASNSSSSSGSRASSPAYRPSRPGLLRRPIFLKMARRRETFHGVRVPSAGRSSNARSHCSGGGRQPGAATGLSNKPP